MNAVVTLKRASQVALLVGSAVILQGCVEALLVGGVATSLVIATDRRQAEVMFADQRIEFSAGSQIGDALKGQGHVNVTSYNYTVLLTGEVPTAKVKAEAEKVASELPHVRSVVNELQIAGTSSAASRSMRSSVPASARSRACASGDSSTPASFRRRSSSSRRSSLASSASTAS